MRVDSSGEARIAAHHFSFVRTVAAISGVYDGLVGLTLLVAAGWLARPSAFRRRSRAIFSDLNGIFLLAIGIGYYWPYRDPIGARWYLWVMGAGSEGGAERFSSCSTTSFAHSPASFLLFAASDGTLAILTLAALVASGRYTGSPAAMTAMPAPAVETRSRQTR